MPSAPDKLKQFENFGIHTPERDLAVLRDLSSSLSGDVVIVEVGSWMGASALALAEANPRARIYCIDHWQGNDSDEMSELLVSPEQAFGQFCRNVGDRLFRQIIPLVGTSRQYAFVWPEDNPVDMVYIDAEHTYESCISDIRCWYPHVKPKGIIAGHDYGVFEGVARAVHEVFTEDVRHKENVWFEHKP